MKKTRFNEIQIISLLKAVEAGHLVKDACREYGIVSAHFSPLAEK